MASILEDHSHTWRRLRHHTSQQAFDWDVTINILLGLSTISNNNINANEDAEEQDVPTAEQWGLQLCISEFETIYR